MIFAAAIALGFAQQALSPLVCPISGEAPMGGAKSFIYAGMKVTLCCPACPATFSKDPAKAIKDAAAKKWVVAQFLFDPVSGARVNLKTTQEFSDYNGIRFPFSSARDKQTFDADPKAYGAMPTKEALFCPVEMHAIDSSADAGGFVDYKGVRYYTCCGDCLAQLKPDPGKFVANSEKSIQELKATPEAEK